MVLSLVLMIIAALPFLAFGAGLLFIPLNAANIPSEVLNSPRLQQAGATPELLISAMRLVGGIVLAIAVLYLLFGILAFAGRNWARIVTTVLTVGFALPLVSRAGRQRRGRRHHLDLRRPARHDRGRGRHPVQPPCERLVRLPPLSPARALRDWGCGHCLG